MKNEKFITDAIGETLLITLYMKSVETKQKNPIIIDHTACKLVSEIDYDFTKFDNAVLSRIGTVLRATYFDKQLIDFIERKNNPVVVLIGCGLDSRVERIGNIGEKAHFYQLDIPETMTIREQLLTTGNNETNIHGSMLETDWIKQMSKEHPDGDYMFIIEGVLMYFKEHDVQSVFKNLAQSFSNSEILFDMASTWSHKTSDKHDAVKLMKARFAYGTDNDKEMEMWADNLQHVSTKLYTDFPEWKRAGWRGKIMDIVPTFRKAHRLLHYKIS